MFYLTTHSTHFIKFAMTYVHRQMGKMRLQMAKYVWDLLLGCFLQIERNVDLTIEKITFIFDLFQQAELNRFQDWKTPKNGIVSTNSFKFVVSFCLNKIC